jgi:arylsulfatase A-like enzyme
MQFVEESRVQHPRLIEGIIEGISAWCVYGILECVFSIILPYLSGPRFDYVPTHWAFLACLIAAYGIAGATAGCIVELAVRHVKQWRARRSYYLATLATGSVVAALCINVSLEVPGKRLYEIAVLGLGAVLIATGLFSAYLDCRNRVIRIAANRWVTLALLMGMFWINSGLSVNRSTLAKSGLFAGYVAGIVLVWFAVSDIAKATRLRELVNGRIRKPMLLASATILVFGIAATLKQQPIVGSSVTKRATASVSGRPNIIMIVMDTVRADHLSLYGYERDTSPNLRELAKHAAVYTQAIAPGDMTLISHASIFTGMYALQHGAYTSIADYPEGRPIDQKAVTLAEILSQKGYFSMAVSANAAYLTRSFGLDQGFDYFDSRSRPRFLERRQSPEYLKDILRRLMASYPVPREWELKWRRAEEINREVFRLLDERQRESKPFFLFINYMDAHRPYVPPPPFDSLYPGKDLLTMSQTDFENLRENILWEKRVLAEKERQFLISQYDGGIAYMDAKIGELIGYLKAHGIYEQSLLIITSDHGEAFGDRNMLEHGCGVYGDQVHVPLIVAEPNVHCASVVASPVNLIDLYPTVLDYAKAESAQPRNLAGRSLKKLDNGEPRWIATESYPMFEAPKMRRVERAILSGSFKFVVSTAGKKELYDLSKDPGEKRNLYNQDGDSLYELERTMNQWIKTAPRPSGKSRKVDRNAIENLKSLGYMK